MSWSTSELRVRLAPLNRFKPSSKIFYWPFQGGTSFVDLLCFCSVLCLLCFVRVCLYVLCGHLLGKGWPLGSRLWCLLLCEFVTFPLVSWVRCGTWLYRFLIFAPLLTFGVTYYMYTLENHYTRTAQSSRVGFRRRGHKNSVSNCKEGSIFVNVLLLKTFFADNCHIFLAVYLLNNMYVSWTMIDAGLEL